MTIAFDYQSMIMYGWVADIEMKITEVNHSLRSAISKSNPSLLAVIDAKKCCLGDLLVALFGDDFGIADSLMEKLATIASVPVPSLDKESEDTERLPGLTVTVFKKFCNGVPIAGVRMVKAGGFVLQNGEIKDRFDFVMVCLFEKVGAEIKCKGYQGQFQEAWSRVSMQLREGTRTGRIALLARNLSHNLGSHALFYLEHDDETAEQVKSSHRFLRQRMEFLAAVATNEQLPLINCPLKEVVDSFTKNEWLLTRICRSEGISSIIVSCNSHQPICIPGGAIGKHAFYSIIENIVRNSARAELAKRAKQNELSLTITTVIADDSAKDFLKVVVYDNNGNFPSAYADLSMSLDQLQIADVSGEILRGNWGIKELVIMAAFLRVASLENVYLQDTPQLALLSNDTDHEEPPLLSIEEVDGNLGWVFYLKMPQEILLINGTDATLDGQQLASFVQLLKHEEWTEEFITTSTSIRQRFLVFCSNVQRDIDSLAEDLANLPARVFVAHEHKSLQIPNTLVSICAAQLGIDVVTPTNLLRRRVAHQLKRRKMSMPVIVHANSGSNVRELICDSPNTLPCVLSVPTAVNGASLWANAALRSKLNGGSVILLCRHGEKADLPDDNTTVILYEPHEDYDPMRTVAQILNDLAKDALCVLALELVEAALTRIMVIDERLDTTSSGFLPSCADWSIRDRFNLKGVDIRGSEFCNLDSIPTPDNVYGWLPSGTEYLDFLLIHHTILTKVCRAHNLELEDFCIELSRRVDCLVVHSGRVDSCNVPKCAKTIPLAHIANWFQCNATKAQIVNDLCGLRRC